MARLYTYVLRWDDGAAPNPFWGICTLAICKPVIRRKADKGSWVVGTGSKNSKLGDTSGQVIYAMRVGDVLPLEKYDEKCRSGELARKVPEWGSADLRRKYGDCIYDYSTGAPKLRPSVHANDNMKTDLGGVNVLISDEFYYFGRNGRRLPEGLLPIVKQGQGHQVDRNDPFVEAFVNWIRHEKQGIHGDPQMWGDPDIEKCGGCRAADDEEDLRTPNC